MAFLTIEHAVSISYMSSISGVQGPFISMLSSNSGASLASSSTWYRVGITSPSPMSNACSYSQVLLKAISSGKPYLVSWPSSPPCRTIGTPSELIHTYKTNISFLTVHTYIKLDAFDSLLDGNPEIFQAVFWPKIATTVGHYDCPSRLIRKWLLAFFFTL